MKKTHTLGVPIHTFDLQWLRGPATHEQGWIVLDKRQAAEYTTRVGPELALDLADVRSPSDAVDFVQSYGMLWHGPGSQEFREPFAEWDEEASALRSVLHSWAAVSLAMKGDALGLAVLRRAAERMGGESSGPASADQKVLARASKAIAGLVSQRLGRPQEGLVPLYDDHGEILPGEFSFVMVPKDLLSATYHQFGRAIVNRIPLAVCAECGRVFGVKDARQKYCSPTCGNRTRYRRWSEKKRLAGEGSK